LSPLLSKVLVASCSFYIKCSMWPSCFWTMRTKRVPFLDHPVYAWWLMLDGKMRAIGPTCTAN